MWEAISFSGGLLLGIVFIIFMITKGLKITKVEYQLVLKNENNIKVLNSFSRYYWKPKMADNDIEDLVNKCAGIRSNMVEVDDYLLSLIDTNFEIDFKCIYLEHVKSTIKPR